MGDRAPAATGADGDPGGGGLDLGACTWDCYHGHPIRGRLAQWESAAFTLQKSLVQIQYRPLKCQCLNRRPGKSRDGRFLPQGPLFPIRKDHQSARKTGVEQDLEWLGQLVGDGTVVTDEDLLEEGLVEQPARWRVANGTFIAIHAAIRWYSLINPPSLATRTTSPSVRFKPGWGSGVSRYSPRCGRSLL